MTFLVKNSIYFEALMLLGFLISIFLGQTWGVYVFLGLLSAIYFLKALNEQKDTKTTFVFGIIRISGVANAISVCSILFRLVSWPGSNTLLIIGLASQIIVVFLAMAAILNNNKNSNYLRLTIIRSMILTIVITVLLLFPQLDAIPTP